MSPNFELLTSLTDTTAAFAGVTDPGVVPVAAALVEPALPHAAATSPRPLKATTELNWR